LPIPPFKTYKLGKEYNIISVCRNTKQKINKKIFKEIEKEFDEIISKQSQSWDEYYNFLSKGKILLITSREETFGYSVLEAVLNNCIPICPNSCSYPDLLPREYLYNNIGELKEKIKNILHNDFSNINYMELKNTYKISNFYNNLYKSIRENYK